MTVEIGLLIAVVGCFVGLAGYLGGRDKKISGDAEWKGGVNAKLDIIVGITNDLKRVGDDINAHGERLTAVEASAKQAHKRIDSLEGVVRHETNNN